jgi:hypothetical protein
MSEFRDTQRNIVAEREAGSVEQCKNLTDGTLFNAEVEEVQDIELNTEFGRDAREQVTIHVSDKVAAEKLMSQEFVAVNLYGVWERFRIVRRKRNPASPQTDFGLMYVTDKDS